MPMFAIRRSQKWSLKNNTSTAITTAIIATTNTAITVLCVSMSLFYLTMPGDREG